MIVLIKDLGLFNTPDSFRLPFTVHLPNGNLSKKQRKRMQRRLNKVSSASRVQDLILNGAIDDDGDGEDNLPNVYYTFQPGDRKLYRSTDRFQLGGDSDSSPETSRESKNQRFRIKKVSPDIPLPSAPTIQVRNMFGALDSSVHDDPTPVKQRSLQYQQQQFVERGAPSNGHLVLLTESEFENEDVEGLLVNGRTHRSRLKGSSTPLQYRSKSTSPLRIGQTAKQKALFKNFDPDKADWISNKKKEIQVQVRPPHAVLVLR